MQPEYGPSRPGFLALLVSLLGVVWRLPCSIAKHGLTEGVRQSYRQSWASEWRRVLVPLDRHQFSADGVDLTITLVCYDGEPEFWVHLRVAYQTRPGRDRDLWFHTSSAPPIDRYDEDALALLRMTHAPRDIRSRTRYLRGLVLPDVLEEAAEAHLAAVAESVEVLAESSATTTL